MICCVKGPQNTTLIIVPVLVVLGSVAGLIGFS